MAAAEPRRVGSGDAGSWTRAEAQSAQRRLTLVEDRQRIARDLHERVIQDLLGLGMELLAGDEQLDAPAQVEIVVDRLDAAVRRLRTVVFDARDPAAEESLSAVLRSTVDEAACSLGHVPVLSTSGPLDELEASIADHLLPAVREALSNVARHAGATATSVDVTLTGDRVVLEVTDDGVGPPPVPGEGKGLRSISERARLLGGDVELSAVRSGGARLRWVVPRPGRADASRVG